MALQDQTQTLIPTKGANKTFEKRASESKKSAHDCANDKPSPKEVSLVIRVILGLVFLILGFTFSNEVFFDNYPLFGRKFLAEFLISLFTASVGFYVVPKAFSALKHWVLKAVFDAVSDIVTDFWEQQTDKMREARQEREDKKELEKKEEEERKAKEEARKEKEALLKEKHKGSMVLDTSVLIDGRLLDIAKTGFLMCDLIVPEFVVDELHTLSDSKDKLKRQKGRRGLDLLKALRKDKKVNLEVVEEFTPLEEGVDKSLVKYAKKYDLILVTLDFSLNKVAGAEGVSVLNLNDLANALRMRYLPGEKFEIKVLDEGKEDGQGVGYLEDGTMVIVEAGKALVGDEVKVCVKKNLQGSAGRMIFAEVFED
ncbi:TRAM domain-containing protein [candidate division WWE3 bacterium]|nr:TRAM domain-containing protein [candidate division WWE3 bacterium]